MNITVGPFGVVTLVFFRRHVDTGEPLYDAPQVWTYNADEWQQANEDRQHLSQQGHLYVPAQGLTCSTHKSPAEQGD